MLFQMLGPLIFAGKPFRMVFAILLHTSKSWRFVRLSVAFHVSFPVKRFAAVVGANVGLVAWCKCSAGIERCVDGRAS